MAKKSDYRDPRTNLFELLPEVFQSQTNEAVFEDVFNRYLSKPQLELVDGFVGQRVNNTALNRQIQEPTPHRQAFQLQPLLYAQVGSVDHLASYVDILNEVSRLGIDDCRLPLWGNALQFNWAPPIDIDKLVNFRDYYWFDPDGSAPQYITIENPCIEAQQRVEAYQGTVDTFGDLQPLLNISSSNKTFTIAGDLTDVFTAGFVFLIVGSTNPTINSTFFTAASSSYNETTDETTIVVSENITDDSIVDGSITLENYLTILQSQQQCACGQDVGWDTAPWDDNQVGDVLWSTGLLAEISWATEAEWIAANITTGSVGSPLGSPVVPNDLALWYDTTNNQLKQFFDGDWVVVQNNFASVVALVDGTHFWDFTSTCDAESNLWTDQNKWYHKNHVPNFASAQQATLPIIEYEFSTQLNRWTFTEYVWKYRESNAFDFEVTETKPTLNELIPFDYVINSTGVGSPVLNKITLSPEYGDQTSVFVEGYRFKIINDGLDAGNNGNYVVASSSYTTTDTTPGDELATVIIIDGTFSSANQSATSLGSPAIVGSGGQLIPRETSEGDAFQDYYEHWLFDDTTTGTEPATGKLLPVPSPPPTVNPFAVIDPLTVPITVAGIGEYNTSTPVDLSESYGVEPYVLTMEYIVQPTIAPGGVPSGTVIPLDPRMISRAPIGESVVRVVHNGQQIYGTFTELDDGVGFGSPAFSGSPVLGGSPLQGINDGFVDSIVLAFDLEEFDTLQITVAEQAVSDIGKASVPVRTVEDDLVFTNTGSPLGSQPEQISLIEYRRVDPLKSDTNEYPLFDLFDCNGEPLFEASPLFRWRTDQNNSVNTNIGLRIVGTTTADFAFENLLIDPTTLPRPTLYTYIGGSTSRTIWRKGLNDEEYVPQYVDENKEVVSVGDPLGAWEIPDQLYYNTEHENRQYVTFPEIITHFRSILNEQTDFPGVTLAGSQAYLHPDINYGLGGRIREFNDSYDTFLSSIFVNNVTPNGLIDFAHDQYENSLNTIKELYRRNLLTYLTDTSTDSILDFQTTVNTAVITDYEQNDFYATVYGDSNTFIPGSPRIGVENWPATLPFVGLAFKKQPYIIEDSDIGLLQLVHHDGHRSEPLITPATRESIVQTLLNTPDSRVTNETFGVQQDTLPPDTYAELSGFITPRVGIYWYSVIGSTRTLYRFAVTAVANSEPSGVPVGALWYDTSTDQLRALESDLMTWTPVVGSPDGIITSAWEEVDLTDTLVNLLLEVEQRLYEAAPDLTELDFDINDVLTNDISCPTAGTTTETETANTYFEQAFSNFLRDIEVDDPYSASQFFVATDAFTWNYTLSTITTGPNIDSPTGSANGAWWTELYQTLYGTPYPHLEPWALQGFTDKPAWWDSEYLNDQPEVYGDRRWKYLHQTGSPLGGSPIAGSPKNITAVGMWENIRLGIVPAGQLLADGTTTSTGAAGEAQTWTYFSVNITDSTIDGFDPDDVFPPFWDYVTNGGSSLVRSVFSNFAGEIVLPSSDYTFDTGGPIIFDWNTSAQRLYDNLTVGFRMQPVRFIHSTFGVNFIEVDGLQLNESNCKVYSHRDVTFHGDIINTNEVLSIDGINQWYVNFNRYNGFDVSASDFRQLWQGWQPQLTYQFGSIIDTQTLQISNTNFGITERDYSFILKKSPAIDDFSLDAFNVTVLESPNKLARFDTQHLWKFQIDTFFPTTRDITYYEVHNYPVRADSLTNIFHLYQYHIVNVDTSGVFYLSGDQTEAFTTTQSFTINDSTGNDGTYTAVSVAFNPSTDQTAITVSGTLDGTVDGFLTASYRTHTWETGDKIELTATQTVPAPLTRNRVYFVIRVDDLSFQLASTKADALAGRNISISSSGIGQVSAGQVFSKFTALDGAATDRVWNHYVLDTRFTRSIIPPHRVTGVQTMVNIIDGYAAVLTEAGWIFNLENYEQDATTGDPISWNLETERFIDQIFRLPRQRASLPDSYPVSVNSATDTLTFNNTAPIWDTGTKISFSAGTGTLPTPLLQNQTYYVIRVDDTTIKVALTSSDAILGVAVDLIGGGSATVSVFETPAPQTRSPAVEINPFRNNIWLNTPQGILSNIVDGPTDDIRNSQLITDQTGKQLTGSDISVYRWDKLARIFVPSPITNPAIPTNQRTPYNTIHMASLQAFVDGYEGVILFNDYAVDGTLIYDPFVGLNTSRFSMRYFRQDEFTQRPVVGGYFITEDDQILRNIESGVLDLQQLYDTYTVLETTPTIIEGRKTIGYQAPAQTFLEQVGLNPKSKFLFWKGMIQNKGSVRAIDAFTNSIRFEDATVDDYWAYKIAEFGSNYQLEYPALKLQIDDSRRNDKRFEFLTPAETTSDADRTFEGILLTNQDRWFEQPNALSVLTDNNSSLYFEAEITNVQTFTSATMASGSPTYWYVETTVPFENVIILHVDTTGSTDTLISTLVEGTDYNIINARLIQFLTDPAIAVGSPITSEYRIYTINPAEDKLNPSKVIDIKANRVVEELPIWDPIRNYQYALANNVVDFESTTDPATYTDAVDLSNVDSQFWNAPEVGITWWDTAQRGYVPYNDSNIFSLDSRVQNWGKLAEWADVKLYEWTKSDILPSEWDAVAQVEELDISIDPLIRKTGRVKLETFQRERTTLDVIKVYPSTVNTGSPQFPVNVIVVDDSVGLLAVGERIVFTTDNELPLPLQSGVFYYIVDIDNTIPSATEIQISLEESGSVLDIKPGPMVIDINGDASIGTNPTGLINDFNTAGVQNISFNTTKSLGSSTGLAVGTEGYQDVDFPFAVTGATSTGLVGDQAAYQIVTFSGSPFFCGDSTGLTPGQYYRCRVTIDGVLHTVIVDGAVASTYTEVAAAIFTSISGNGIASCEISDHGIRVTSNTLGPSSSVLIQDGPAGTINSLFASIAGSAIQSPVAGITGLSYEFDVSINNGAAQSVDVSGGDAQTMSELVDTINSQITGATASIFGGDLRIQSNETGISSTVDITDVDLFSSMAVSGGSPGAGTILPAVQGTGTLYQTNIAVNGGALQTVLLVGDDALTLGELIDIVNDNISGATISLLSGALRITSNASGSSSSIDVIDGGTGSPIITGLFESLNNVEAFTGTPGIDRRPSTDPVDGLDGTRYTIEIDFENGPRLITVIGNEAQNWNQLLAIVNAQLPSGVLSTVVRNSPQETHLLLDAGNNTVTISDDDLFTRLGETFSSPVNSSGIFFNQFISQDTGDGNHLVVPSFADEDWIQIESITKELYASRDNNGSDQYDATTSLGSPTVPPNSIVAGDVVDIYVNGFLHEAGVTVPLTGLVSITGLNPADYIVIRKEKHVVTDEQAEFDPDVFDDGTNLIQYKDDYNFSTTYRINEFGNQVPVYYFWVENKTTRTKNNVSMRQAVVDLETIPTPYMILNNLLDPIAGAGSPLNLDAPYRYTQLILRGLAGVVDDTDRYILRFTRNFTLRNSLIPRNYTTDLTAGFSRVGADPLDLKSNHTEWTLIREKQPFNVPRTLWDKITESIIGRKITSNVRVPSIAREVYDLTYDTDTQYGLEDGQAFVNGELALATIIDDLQDPNNDFSPNDVNVFFATHDFTTEDGLISVMDDIYNTFTSTSINRMYFKVLLDALTTKQKYPGIFKTSWVALSGTQVFQTEALFSG